MTWGILTSIDLKNCDPNIIKDRIAIATYARRLVNLIEMKAYGNPQIIHFGSCKEVEGFTLVQLIETSLIAGHFVNETNEAFIDIFSCKEYDEKNASSFTFNYFNASNMSVKVTQRGNWKDEQKT
jgi:S-adenosylmethionine/arginine decarboxylase-like enzyme